MTPLAALDRGLAELGCDLPRSAQAKLLDYLSLLEKWNRTYNLTAIRNRTEMVSRHLLDSLAVLPHLPGPQEEATLADVGSGAGLPGVPLAIARPQWQVTLNDASEKKSAFLRQAAIELRLPNVQVHAGRVEHWRPVPRFAVAISRAFTELRAFIVACRHLVRSGGTLAAMVGAPPQAPADAQVIRLRVPLLDAQRHLVLCPVA